MANIRRSLPSFPLILQVLAHLAVLTGVILAGVEISDYRKKQSAELVLRFGEYLDDEPYLSISLLLDTYDSGVKVFQPEGRFSTGEIDRYLGTFETLAELHKNGLITDDMLENGFAYYVQKAYSNDEIRKYIRISQNENPAWWTNFVYIAEMFERKPNETTR